MRKIKGHFNVTMLVGDTHDYEDDYIAIIEAAIESYTLGITHQLKAFLETVYEDVGVNVFPVTWEDIDD